MPDSQYRPAARYETLVDKHEQDLYRGNGKPGITTRLQQLEDCVDSLEAYNTERDRKIQTRMNLLIGALFSLVAAFLLLLFKH